MGLIDIPTELLLEIFNQVQDVYSLMKCAGVCKRFQQLIKSMVLILGDSPTQSPYFNSICGSYFPMDTEHLQKIDDVAISRHSLFILEYRSRESFNDLKIRANLSDIIKKSKSSYNSVIDVFITEQSLGGLSLTVHQDQSQKLLITSRISKTIVILEETKRVKPLKYLNYSQLELIGHDYEFHNVEQLPKLYLTVNPNYEFKISSKYLKILNGIVNVSMTTPRLPPLLKFLELSNLPNLETLNEISIEAGLSLKVFEKYGNLKKISLQSAFTGNSQLQISNDTSFATLKSLEFLNITGNSISLTSTLFPKLKYLGIELFASVSRRFSDSLYIDRIECPVLEELHIHISSLPRGLAYITSSLKNAIKGVQILSLSSNTSSFLKVFENLEFDNLKQLELKNNDIDTIDVDNSNWRSNPQNLISSYETLDIDSNALIFPKLEILHLTRSSLRQISNFINKDVRYPNLKELVIQFRVGEYPQKFIFDKETFPVLQSIHLYCSNRYGPLKNCDITVQLKDLPHLNSFKIASVLNVEVDEGDPYGLLDIIEPMY